MAKTQIRSSQFRSKDIKELQLANESVSGSTANKNGIAGVIKQGSISNPDIRNKAVSPSKMASDFINITSVGGILTLNDESCFFIVDGYESITQIKGCASGRMIIQWNTDRTLVHTGGQLEIQGNINRSVKYGDISTFIFYSDGYAREVGYASKVPVDNAIKIVEFLATEGQTYVELPVIPISKDYVSVSVNGLDLFGVYYNIVGTGFNFSSALDEGDEVRITVINRSVAQATAGGAAYDGGGF